MAEHDPDLGQHFIVDPEVIEQVVALGELTPASIAVDVGAGDGALSRRAAAAAREVFAVEVDPRWSDGLHALAARHRNVTVVIGDVFEFGSADRFGDAPVVFANPSFVTVERLIGHLATWTIERAVLIAAARTVARMTAGPGDPDFSRVSIYTGAWFDVRPAQVIPPEAFDPPPRTSGQAVVLVPKPRDATTRVRQLLADALYARAGERVRDLLARIDARTGARPAVPPALAELRSRRLQTLGTAGLSALAEYCAG